MHSLHICHASLLVSPYRVLVSSLLQEQFIVHVFDPDLSRIPQGLCPLWH